MIENKKIYTVLSIFLSIFWCTLIFFSLKTITEIGLTPKLGISFFYYFILSMLVYSLVLGIGRSISDCILDTERFLTNYKIFKLLSMIVSPFFYLIYEYHVEPLEEIIKNEFGYDTNIVYNKKGASKNTLIKINTTIKNYNKEISSEKFKNTSKQVQNEIKEYRKNLVKDIVIKEVTKGNITLTKTIENFDLLTIDNGNLYFKNLESLGVFEYNENKQVIEIKKNFETLEEYIQWIYFDVCKEKNVIMGEDIFDISFEKQYNTLRDFENERGNF